MAAILLGKTISLSRILNDFDKLPTEKADKIIYTILLPLFEQKGVKLSNYGNHAGMGSIYSVEEYDARKEEHQLFHVETIQRAFAILPTLFEERSTYNLRASDILKFHVENHFAENRYVSNGDFIVAMLLRGYQARFGKHKEFMTVNCKFKVNLLFP